MKSSKSFHVEGYGCSLNISETEKTISFLKKSGLTKADISDADFLIINTCAVKQVTEQRMISRIKKLLELKKKGAKIIVTGCLAATREKEILKYIQNVIVLDTKLESLAEFLSLSKDSFNPELNSEKSKLFTSIIPIALGCKGDCTFCITKFARKKLVSYPIEKIKKEFELEVSHSKEVYLTAQDTAVYGLDINSSLPNLLSELLKTEGKYFVRVGMMNPAHFLGLKKELMPLFNNSHLYKFLHLPMQSGSDKILKNMNRYYSSKQFFEAISFARKEQPLISLYTDVIVGFPGETEVDFEDTLSLLKKVKPVFVNVSRFGKRPGTKAAKMDNQLTEAKKKERSRIVYSFLNDLFLKNKKRFLKKEFIALVSEKKKNCFVARTQNYLPVVVNSNLGEFVKVKLDGMEPHHFSGLVTSKLDKNYFFKH